MIRYYIVLNATYRPRAEWWIPAAVAKALRERQP